MIETKQIFIKKKLPFDADTIESELKEQGYNVLRWAVVKVTDTDFIIDAAIINRDNKDEV
ncbi:MAG: hypothetical protein ACI37T_00010 [Candidatus Gastranaerophilaceae bacterium]